MDGWVGSSSSICFICVAPQPLAQEAGACVCAYFVCLFIFPVISFVLLPWRRCYTYRYLFLNFFLVFDFVGTFFEELP